MPYFYLTPALGGPDAPRYVVTDELQLIGRSEAAEIALLEPTVSREHATVQLRNGTVRLEDLGSKHGTFVNSKRIKHSQLKVGDIVVFGLSLVLRLEASDDPVAEAPQLFRGDNDTASLIRKPQTETATVSSGSMQRRSAMIAPTGPTVSAPRERELGLRLHKLAAAGAFCGSRLPKLRDELHAVYRQAQQILPVGYDRLLDALGTLMDDVSELADTAAIERPVLEPVSLFQVVHNVARRAHPVAGPRRVEIDIGISQALRVLSDADRLSSALLSLVERAAAVSPVQASVAIQAHLSEQHVMLTISDSGPAFPNKVLESLFDPFLAVPEEWESAIGPIVMAKWAIVALSGELKVEGASELWGTTVRLSLPSAS